MADGLKTLPALTEIMASFSGQLCPVKFLSLLRGCNMFALEYGLLLVLILVNIIFFHCPFCLCTSRHTKQNIKSEI